MPKFIRATTCLMCFFVLILIKDCEGFEFTSEKDKTQK